MVNFYCDVFPKHSHFLAPLNKLSTKKGKDWYWEAAEQKVLEEAKNMLTVHATLAFPDFEQPFGLYTDASDWQLGATLVQNENHLDSTLGSSTLYIWITLLERRSYWE